MLDYQLAAESTQFRVHIGILSIFPRTIAVCLPFVSKTIHISDCSQNMRSNMGLIDPSSLPVLYQCHQICPGPHYQPGPVYLV